MIKKIRINGLRGFGEEKELEFTLPNGVNGSGLNIIVGPNNSGKTTILEALKYYKINENQISFSEGKRNKKNNYKVDIMFLDEDDNKFEIHTVEYGGSQIKIVGETDNRLSPYILQSRRYVEYNMNNQGVSYDRYNYSSNSIQNSINRTSFLSYFEYRIAKWQKEKQEFDSILKKIITEPFDWNIEQSDNGSYYIKMTFNDNSIVHTREGIGDGYWSIFTICDAIYDAEKNNVIIIDEPELSLHPELQKRVLKLLEEHSKDKQIIITTHSPYFISLNSLVNGGNLIRTFKDNAGDIDIFTLKQNDKKFIESLILDLNNPHIMGLEAKELFFIDDNIVITEGQEDVVIIPKICKALHIHLNANIFGWGAGGAEKITKLLDMLNSL